MVIVFKVEGYDTIQGYLGNTRQIVKTMPIPPNGTTTTIPVTAILRSWKGQIESYVRASMHVIGGKPRLPGTCMLLSETLKPWCPGGALK
jgi:hypothetical protein